MFASARVVHHKTTGLRFWRNNQWRILQPAILIANRKKPRRSGQGAWRGVNGFLVCVMVGIRSPWSFCLSFGWALVPHALQIPRWVFPGISGTVFGFTFWTVCTARTGQFKAVDPQYEQTIEGHKLGSVRMARPGRTTSDQQWRLNGLRVCDTRMACICTNVDCPQVSCRYLLRKFNGSARSYWRLDRVHTQSLPLWLKLVEFNPHVMHRPPRAIEGFGEGRRCIDHFMWCIDPLRVMQTPPPCDA